VIVSEQPMKIFAGARAPTWPRDLRDPRRALARRGSCASSDGELYVEIGENVRGSDVFVIQSTALRQREPDGALDRGRRSESGHRRAASARCFPTTAMPVRIGRSRHAHPLRKARVRPDRGCGCDPRLGARSTCRSDSGLLQRAVRPPVRHAGPARSHEGELPAGPDRARVSGTPAASSVRALTRSGMAARSPSSTSAGRPRTSRRS